MCNRLHLNGNRLPVAWGLDVGTVKCKYCAKTISGGVFRFKHHFVETREDYEPCATVPDEIKLPIMKIVVESKATKENKRRLNSINEDEESAEGVEASQATDLNFESIDKKKYKPLVDAQVAEFFYTSVIPFNAIKNLTFLKMCEMIRKYGPGYKPPTYYNVREKLLKQTVQKIDDSLKDFRDEWKRTYCSIMFDGWTDKKRCSICNFLVNNPKGTIFMYSLDTFDISKTTGKVFKMLDDVVTFFGEENVVQMITDNVANFKANMLISMLKKYTNGRDLVGCYESIWEIIDKRWENQLHRPLHAAAYYLNPQLHFEDDLKKDKGEGKEGLFICMMRLVKDIGNAINSRKTMQPAKWWEMFGDGHPELKWFAIHVHTKRRNRLHQKKMTDSVYMMYNLKPKSRPIRTIVTLPFEDMQSNDEWITTRRH
uniref:DUF659 domain-containing protein n=1 Tax=Glycine max TaxID=3847 RepID=A0A0R0E3Z8_SOYBN